MNSGLVRSIADLSSRWRNRFSRSRKSSDPDQERGALGEKLAARFLRKQGYKVLYRNFKLKKHKGAGQIDLVCRDHETLVFVEVKTRSSEDLRRPVDELREDQKRRISRGALAWLRMLDNPDIPFRFDVVEVLALENQKPRFELIQDAFRLSAPYMY